MSVTTRSTPNIALIKYWGNRNNERRLPETDSLSFTLDAPSVDITVDHAEALTLHSFKPDGAERELTEKDIARFQTHLDLTKEYLSILGAADAIPHATSIEIHSHIPPGIGLASSAAVFSCLARAYAGLIKDAIVLTDEQVSVIARLGSGSASRSIYGGFVALVAGNGEAIDSAKAAQIADEHHWPLHDIVVAPSNEHKKVGSTEGHAIAQTSPLFEERIEAIKTRRQQECIDAILQKDFEKLQKVAEEDCMNMHEVMRTSTPSLQYLTDDTYRIIDEVTALRESKHLPVLYTMDAGPTVHLICTDEARDKVAAFAQAQEGCTVYETKMGSGAYLLE